MGFLPSGITSSPGGDIWHTWASYSMPYLEQGNAYDTIDFSRESWRPFVSVHNRSDNDEWAKTQLPIHLCPSDEGRGIHEGASQYFAHGNYLANVGTTRWWQRQQEDNIKMWRPEEVRGPSRKPFPRTTGGLSCGGYRMVSARP